MYKIDNNHWYLPLNKIVLRTDYQIENESEIIELLGSEWFSKISNYENELLKMPKKTAKFENIYPCTLGIIPTNSCSLRCIYCYSESGQQKEIHLSMEQISSSINLLIKNALIHKKFKGEKIETKISFCGGGEPTYNWKIFKYAIDIYKERTKSHGIESSILLITNGILDKHKADYVIEKIDKINVSFDGMSLIQNSQRPLSGDRPSFDIVDEFIKNCEGKGKEIEIRATVMKENFTKLKEISKFIFTNYLNVKRLHVEPLFSVGRGELLEEPSQEDLNLFALNYIEAYGFVSNNFKGKELFNSSFFYELKEYFCSSALGIHPWVHMDGKIMPCTEYIIDENNILGEITDEGFSFNRKFDSIMPNMNKCQMCFAYYQCGGGCVRNIIKNEKGECATNYSKKFCEMTKFFWGKVLKALVDEKEVCGLKGKKINTVSNKIKAIQIEKINQSI